MKEFWLEITKAMSSTLRQALIEATGHQCNVLLSQEIDIATLKAYNLCIASLEGGDISVIDESKLDVIDAIPKPNCLRLVIKDQRDEETVIKAARKGVDYVAISCSNWKIIPLENLIAKVHGNIKLLAEVSNADEAKVALETLELGVDGIILNTLNVDEVKLTLNALITLDKYSKEKGKIKLVFAKITQCTKLSVGDRVCIDTCDILSSSEGMLVGCSSSGLFLVQAEVQLNPYVEPRPFRVNAGPVSLYILAPDNKTHYLSELRAGDETLIVDREGRLRKAIIGRIKIERRPLMLIEAEIDDDKVKCIVQNAETIHLVTKQNSKSVTELRPGDEVLVFHQRGGRHFGTLVDEETAIEK
ncbi:MAG: 3-dehydroquinate synthase II [Candidatus Bathyarchaeota archaeon]